MKLKITYDDKNYCNAKGDPGDIALILGFIFVRRINESLLFAQFFNKFLAA